MGNISQQKVYPGESENKTTWYQYKPKLNAIIPGEDKPIDVSKYISDLSIFNNYDENAFPYIATMLVLPKAERLKIQNAADSVRFTLSIDRFDPNDEKKEFHINYFEEIVLKAIDPQRANMEPGSTDKPEDGSEMADNIPQHNLPLYLFKSEHLDINKKLVHASYSETTVSDVLLKLVQDNFKSSEMKFNIGKVDNTKVYEQIVIPPMPFVKAVNYLQKNYGIFNNGLNMFFDMKDAWIMDPQKVIEGPDPKKSIVNAALELFSPNEKSLVGNSQIDSTFLDEKNNKFLIRTSLPVQISTPRTAVKELLGEAVRFLSNTIDANEEENCVNLTFGTPTNSEKQAKEVIYWNNTSNPMRESEFKAQMSNIFNTVKMDLPQSDIEVWGINRMFNMENKQENASPGLELDGQWKCKSAVFTLSPKGDTGTYDARVNVELRKIRFSA